MRFKNVWGGCGQNTAIRNGALWVVVLPLAALVLALTTPIDQAWGEESPTPATVESRFREMHRNMVSTGITPEDAEATIRAMETNRFTHEQMVRVGALMEEERRNSMHSEAVQAIRGKVHEGIAKGIAPDRILEAAAKVAGRVRTSTALARDMNLQARQALVSVYADSLAAGLTEEDARRLSSKLNQAAAQKSRPAEPLIMETMLTARDLVRQRVTSRTTADLLGQALDKGFSAEEIGALRSSFAAGSGNPENRARSFDSAISRGHRGLDLQGIDVQKGRAGFGVDAPSKGGGAGGTGPGADSGTGGAGSDGGSGAGSGSGSDGGSGGGSGGGGGGGGGGNGGGGRS